MAHVHPPMMELREAIPSSLPATREQRRWAGVVVIVSAAIFLAAAPFARVPLFPVPAFIPSYQSALVVNDLITAALLFGQLHFFRSRALLVLAGGYLFTALMALAHALTFPGLFAPTGLLGAGPQTTAWIYMFWHGAFPLFVIAYALLSGEFHGRRAMLWCIVSTFAAACLLTLAATAGQGALPAIMSGNQYTPLMLAVVASVWMLSLIAFLFLWRKRPHTVVDVWLMVVMWAWIFDIALAAVLNGGRFDVGFYAGRIYGLLAASLVLIVLLLENGKLYAHLREKNGELQRARLSALDAERAKGAFLATMSHEIRTPMSGVMGMLELLSLTRLDTEQRDTLQVVRESGRSLLRILDDILDFSRMEAGKLELRPEATSIAALVEQVHHVYMGNASSKGLAFERFVDPRISPALMADPLRLGQILNNLASNAIKFTAEGRVAIRADLVERREGKDVVRFSVEDTGTGISAEEAKRLFQPFAQAGGAGAGGSGLGLSICQRLIAMMDGLLHMESEPGIGTRMLVTLPLSIADASLATTPRRPSIRQPGLSIGGHVAPTVDEARLSGSLILVVDDHPTNRAVLVKQLNALGYATETACNGLEAIDKWNEGGLGAIITDCRMPEMNGYELARHIRACEARSGGRIPIIACTGNAMDGEAAKCLAAGMDDCLVKPLRLDGLRRKLEQWVPLAGPIDRAVLAELSEGKPEAEREFLAQFRSFNEEDVRALKRAVAAEDVEGVVSAAHRIKGASRAVGAAMLADACERLEQAGRANDWATVHLTMIPFDRELQRLHAHIAIMESAS